MQENRESTAVNIPSVKLDTDGINNRFEELKKAQLKLSSGSTHRRHRNSLSGYPVFQTDTPYDQDTYSATSKIIEKELSNPTFQQPVKAIEKWANQLNSPQLITLACVLFKRFDASQIQAIQSLLKQCQKEPAFFFGTLTNLPGEDKEDKTSEEDSITKLMSALSISEVSKKKNSGNPYRKSLPVTFDLGLNKPRYEPFNMDIPEDTPHSPIYYNLPSSKFPDDSFNPIPKGEWLTPQTRSIPLSPTIPSRIRPKSMFEPGLLNASWNNADEFNLDPTNSNLPSENGIWNNALPQNYNNNSVNGQNNFTLPHYNDNLRNHNTLSINIQQDHYIPTTTYSAGIPPRNMYNQTMNNVQNQTMINIMPSNPFSPSNWMGFKDKSKRRSNGENEMFAQGARNMFSNIQNPFRKHLTKPHNKVDFDLLQDIPSWLRTLRLHKYTSSFDGMVWQDIIKLTDEELTEKGISALGARRKMLKHFELVKQELQNKNKVK